MLSSLVLNFFKEIMSVCWRRVVIQPALSGYFIIYTSVVLGRTHFGSRTASFLRKMYLTRCWKHSFGILVRVVSIASHNSGRFLRHTFMLQTSPSPSIGLRSVGHWSKLKSLSCLWTQLRWCILCDVAQYPAGSIHLRKGRLHIKGCTWSASMLMCTVTFKWGSGGIKRHNVCQENMLTIWTHPPACTVDRMGPWIYALYAKFWPCHLHVAAEIELHQSSSIIQF